MQLSFRSARVVSTNATKKAAAPRKTAGGSPSYGLWLPNTERPDWLSGDLPGDRGFDPLGLSKPGTFVQIGVDGNDNNLSQNLKGGVEGVIAAEQEISGAGGLSPYSEAFGLDRFRENETIHGRWCMLACLGCLVSEVVTGVSWVDAGKVELDGASWWGLELPFSITTLIWIEVFLVGGAEFYRNGETDIEKRIYPGGPFDPLNFASGDKAFNLKTAEIKHGRLAMVAFFGFSAQALFQGEGVLGSLIKFADSL